MHIYKGLKKRRKEENIFFSLLHFLPLDGASAQQSHWPVQ